ncbi:MAG: radical SAM protein, partial [Spirochaetia bacterium]|nr:radical SAM protein [Spirochaetia bacterium]
MKALILDFYVDEPACFGVPPYISPYCRYTAGSLAAAGIPEKNIHYMTVDDYRRNKKTVPDDYALVILIAGATVPGRYLGGKIGSVAEILEFLDFRKKHQKHSLTLIGGPVKYSGSEICSAMEEKRGLVVRGDIELYAGLFAEGKPGLPDSSFPLKEKRTYGQIDLWAESGAFITTQHPNFPYLILELETYRGCTRNVYCSFCSEAFYGRPTFRKPEGIFSEVRELYRMGNRYFRLGRQADLMSYLPKMNDIQNSFPRPDPKSINLLYSGIRKAAPELKMLHLDNINPGILSTFPEESEEILKIICSNNTAGDTAAMGIESVDSAVITLNDLKSSEEESFRAVEIVNRHGSRRNHGIPLLLPGLNFIHGLAGESDSTFEKNYNFLKKILDAGLLLRRINIRQAAVHSKSRLERILAGNAGSEK